jgi:glycosyltransferase involved in cell wall biosynthesis
MRRAIQCFLDHPEEARRMGQNARLRVEQELNLDRYVDELADLIEEFG